MRKLITHKIRKNSIFKILNSPRPIIDKSCFLFIFLIRKNGGKKIRKDINNFVFDNQNTYGGFALLHDHIDMKLTNLFYNKQPALIEILADGIKRFNDIRVEKSFWKDVERLTIARRSNQKAIIIETSEENIPFKIQQNADFIFVPKNMELDERYKTSQLIRY